MKNKDFLIIAGITLFTVLCWMFFEIVHTSQQSTITPTVALQIKTIIPSFDTNVLRILKEREQ